MLLINNNKNKNNMKKMYDCIIIGGGVIGASIARYLMRYKTNVLVIERNSDVGDETSGANSGIVHSGYDPKPNSLKAKFNVEGNKMFDQVCKELDFEFKRIGSLTLAFNDEEFETLKKLQIRGLENGVETQILSKEETLKLEPNLNENIKGSLLAPTCGIVDPFMLTIKLIENAMDNGASLELDTEIVKIEKIEEFYRVFDEKERVFEAKSIVNAAGINADKITNLLEKVDYEVLPRRGQYFLLDHFNNTYINHVIFMCPSKVGKGVLVSPTTSLNYIIGPTFEECEREDTSTTLEGFDDIRNKATKIIKEIPNAEVIRQFSGVRPNSSTDDFVIYESKTNKNFFNVGGIMSPGLASSLAIGEYVSDQVALNLKLEKNDQYNPCVRKRKRWKNIEELDSLIKEDSDYGKFICRCEKVSKKDIEDCINRNAGARTVKGVKKRVRAGFGRCQGTFCQEEVVKLLAKNLNKPVNEIKYSSKGNEVMKYYFKGKDHE